MRHGGYPDGGVLRLVSTYPPTACGIATFGAALVNGVANSAQRVEVVQLTDAPVHPARREVVHQLVAGGADSLRTAARILNDSRAVLLQHEYGIYGGEEGRDVLDLLDRLEVPVVATLHTVLRQPSAAQRTVMDGLVEAVDRLVVMTEDARRNLCDVHDVDPHRIAVIPHGARVRVGRGTGPRRDHPVLLTWGLLGPGKGIEWAIDALAELTDLDPQPHFVICGRTHPKVLAREGERYREHLQQRARDRGVDHLVEFDDRYQESADLLDRIRSADVVVLPYDSREQSTSGVLTDAVACGRPVVSTPFPHARELARTGAVALVPHEDPAGIAAGLRVVLTDPASAERMAAAAARIAPQLSWADVAARYVRLATTIERDAPRVVA